MRNLMKLIVITVITVLLLCTVLSCAFADEKIYTSPVFKLPADKVEEWMKSQSEETEPEEGEEPEAEETGESQAEQGETPQAEQGETPQPEQETTGEATDPEEKAAETREGSGEEQAPEKQESEPAAKSEEPEEKKREVRVYSSQGSVATEGDLITLYSELIGFDDEPVIYRWQVDRGDGKGWVDLPEGNRAKYSFPANRETVQYRWRLIVDIAE